MWVEFVSVVSFVPRGFSPGTLVFTSPQKTNTSKFQFDLERADTLKRVFKNSLVLSG